MEESKIFMNKSMGLLNQSTLLSARPARNYEISGEIHHRGQLEENHHLPRYTSSFVSINSPFRTLYELFYIQLETSTISNLSVL